jgi:hypothetical protein
VRRKGRKTWERLFLDRINKINRILSCGRGKRHDGITKFSELTELDRRDLRKAWANFQIEPEKLLTE